MKKTDSTITVKREVDFEIHDNGEKFKFTYYFDFTADLQQPTKDVIVDCEEKIDIPASYLEKGL